MSATVRTMAFLSLAFFIFSCKSNIVRHLDKESGNTTDKIYGDDGSLQEVFIYDRWGNKVEQQQYRNGNIVKRWSWIYNSKGQVLQQRYKNFGVSSSLILYSYTSKGKLESDTCYLLSGVTHQRIITHYDRWGRRSKMEVWSNYQGLKTLSTYHYKKGYEQTQTVTPTDKVIDVKGILGEDDGI